MDEKSPPNVCEVTEFKGGFPSETQDSTEDLCLCFRYKPSTMPVKKRRLEIISACVGCKPRKLS
jgi:hypothetical protein